LVEATSHTLPPGPVASVRPPLVHVGLPAECHRAGSPVAGFHVELRLIDEAGHGSILPTLRRPSGQSTCSGWDQHRPAEVGHRVDHPQRLGQTVVGPVLGHHCGQELLHGLGHDLEDGRSVALDLLGGVGVLAFRCSSSRTMASALRA